MAVAQRYRLANISDTARYLGMSRFRLHRIMQNDERFPKPARVPGAMPMVDLDMVDKWLSESRQTAA